MEWARKVKIDLDQARQYTEAVFEMTESYLEGISADELDRVVDLTAHGFGEQTVAWILQALMISHLNSMSGEISCLKGLQGAQGYPF